RAITIENWDKTAWEVFTDKDQVEYPTYPGSNYDYKDKLATSQALREVKLIDGGYPRDIKYLDLKTDKKDLKVLGVKFKFTYPGNNEVTIRPPRSKDFEIVRPRGYVSDNNLTSKEQKTPVDKRSPSTVVDTIYGIEFPGVAKAVSVWVCGRGNDYDLEGWIEDYKGDTHVLKFGNLGFVGWRPMTAKVPSYIPQFTDTYPASKTAVFKQFKIRSNPRSTGETVFLFLDELRVLTDAFEVHFDGANLHFDDEDCNNKLKLEKVLSKMGDEEAAKIIKNCGGSDGKSSGGTSGGSAPAKK
ncbi:MAG: hypothetical protein KDK36_03135, partial [Leptospiraceae bacterium]|nr:hypothetical protein [Leptospiraceae bacterium]